MLNRKIAAKSFKSNRKTGILLILSAIVLTACTAIKTGDLTLPPNTSNYNSMLEAGAQFAVVERQITDFLVENKYKNFDNVVRQLSVSSTAQEIDKFYDEQLSKKGFTKELSPLKSQNAEVLSWTKPEWFNNQIVIVAVIENRQAETNEVKGKSLLVYTAQK